MLVRGASYLLFGPSCAAKCGSVDRGGGPYYEF